MRAYTSAGDRADRAPWQRRRQRHLPGDLARIALKNKGVAARRSAARWGRTAAVHGLFSPHWMSTASSCFAFCQEEEKEYLHPGGDSDLWSICTRGVSKAQRLHAWDALEVANAECWIPR